MDFQPSEEQALSVESMRRFVAREVSPLVETYDDATMPAEIVKSLLSKLTTFGILNGWTSESNGGLGLSYVTSALLYEALAEGFVDLAGTAFISEGAAHLIASGANEALKERYAKGLLAGQTIGCFGITEPGCGSNPKEIATRAVRDHAGYRISGSKVWISNGGIADFCVVLARMEDGGMQRILVDRVEHGYTSREISKLGMGGWSTSELFFDDVWVPAENVIIARGNVFEDTQRSLENARLFAAVFANAIARAALDAAIAYAKERRQFGKPIGQHQMVQDLIATSATELEAARLLTLRGFDLSDRGRPLAEAAAMAKHFATEAAVRITHASMQVFGSYGLSKDFPVERHYRNARMFTVPDGTTQINKLIVARSILGMSAF